MSYTVAPANPGQNDHLIWSPEAHAFYREVCVFYLISTSDPTASPSLHTSIGSICESAGISSYCAYYIFGLHDAFVRLWVTEASLLEFLEGLERTSIRIDDIRDFRVDRIHYTFQQKHPSPDDIHNREDPIKRVAQAFRLGSLSQVSEDVTRLLEEGVLLQVPPAEGLKVYILLTARSRAVTPASAEVELRAVSSACAATPLANVSIYPCKSRWADYLIKGIAPDFSALQRISDAITVDLSSYGFKTWTIPIPNVPGIHEIDSLDGAVLVDTPVARRLIATLVHHGLVDARRRFYELSDEARRRLEVVYSEFESQLGQSEARHYFTQFFDAVVRKDEVGLSDSLSFLTQIEALIKQLIPQFFVVAMGSDWKAQVDARMDELDRKNQIEKDSEEDMAGSTAFWKSRPISRWMLSQILQYTRVAADLSSQFDREVRQILFDDWKHDIRLLIDTRNRFTHGSLSGELYSFEIESDTWENDARAILKSARYYAALRALYLRKERG